MKHTRIIIYLTTIFFVACSPSPQAIQTAIAQTQIANQTDIAQTQIANQSAIQTDISQT
jgi:hypothetical protein